MAQENKNAAATKHGLDIIEFLKYTLYGEASDVPKIRLIKGR